MKEFSLKVKKKHDGYKAVDFLKATGVSLEIIQKIKKGGVLVNGEVLINVNDLVKNKDEVKIILPKDQANEHIVPIKDNVKVLYEDEYLIAVVKESGVITHSSKYNESPSLEQMVCGYFLPDTFTFRPINRLDKDTSGIVLIAKDEFTASLLNEQIKNGKMKKT
jgi:23S rRNA pseudouridine1911/1915/1917 synthase